MTDNPNMRIWSQVEKTDPSHTKKVNQRGGFTAISAHYQIMQATKQFGPVGEGWGYINGDAVVMAEKLVVVPVTIWHGSRENTFGPLYGAAELIDRNGRIDSDAPKKASTDGLTKGLSQLGFNADVFLGKFDDNKYVAAMEREFAPRHEPETQQRKTAPLQGPIKTRAAIRTACGNFARDLEACADDEMLEGLLESEKALLDQVKAEVPFFWEGDGADFLGLEKLIDRRRQLIAMGEAA